MNKCFIKATEEYSTFERYVPAPYVRKTFDLADVPDSAEISVCGLGFYILYINGVNVTKGPLAPYISINFFLSILTQSGIKICTS